MANVKLSRAIINYLKQEAEKPDVASDTKESLEVAVQCLQAAYDIDPNEEPTDVLPFSFEELFQAACLPRESDEPSQPDTHKAEMMKNLGNELMRSNQFAEAVKYYTAAIDLDKKNAIYYGNRAAAYSRLNDFQNALKDCEKAIEIDPNYAKVYGRMGLAYSSLEKHDQAIQALKKAIELDPNNDSYQSNLKMAQEKKAKSSNSPSGGLGHGLGGFNLQALFTNPAFRNLASTVMQDPNIITALSSGLATTAGQNPPSSATTNTTTGSGPVPNAGNNIGNIGSLLEAGQFLAAQMQAANPDLVEQMRQTASRTFNRPNEDNRDPSNSL